MGFRVYVNYRIAVCFILVCLTITVLIVGHYRPHFHHVSYYRGRYTNFNHYSAPHRVRDQRVFHSYRRSDFGSVRFRPNTSTRPHNAPTRPGNSSRPGSSTTRPGTSRPSTSTRPDTSTRPGTTTRPGTSTSPSGIWRKIGLRLLSDHLHRPEVGDLSNNVAPDKNGNTNRVESDRNSGRRPETGSGSSSSNRRPTSGSSTGFSSSNRESGKTSSSSRKVQVNETIVVPIIEITVPREIIALPVPVAVVPVVVAPVVVAPVAVAVLLLVVAAVPLLTG